MEKLYEIPIKELAEKEEIVDVVEGHIARLKVRPLFWKEKSKFNPLESNWFLLVNLNDGKEFSAVVSDKFIIVENSIVYDVAERIGAEKPEVLLFDKIFIGQCQTDKLAVEVANSYVRARSLEIRPLVYFEAQEKKFLAPLGFSFRHAHFGQVERASLFVEKTLELLSDFEERSEEVLRALKREVPSVPLRMLSEKAKKLLPRKLKEAYLQLLKEKPRPTYADLLYFFSETYRAHLPKKESTRLFLVRRSLIRELFETVEEHKRLEKFYQERLSKDLREIALSRVRKGKQEKRRVI